MNGALVFFLFVTFAVVLTAGLFVYMQSVRELNSAFAKLARKYGGTTSPGSPLQHPQTKFHYKGSPVVVKFQSAGNQQSTEFTLAEIRWPDPALRIEVYPEGIRSRLGKLMGMEDIEVGDAEFDQRFIISGNDHPAIRRFLTPGVRAQIEMLRRYRGIDDFYLSLAGGRLVVKKRGFLREYALLQRFVQMTLDLYDQALLSNTEGIDFVDGRPAADDKPAVCQICGDEIQEDLVFCTSCRTPHHRDCWRYYGACSTYGCGQTRFRE